VKYPWPIRWLIYLVNHNIRVKFKDEHGSNKIIVTRVRHRWQKHPPSYLILSIYLANTGRQEILVFYQWKNGMGVAT